MSRLQQALINWRAAERTHARAVLAAEYPVEIRSRADAMDYALHNVRLIVDSEPWAEIARND